MEYQVLRPDYEAEKSQEGVQVPHFDSFSSQKPARPYPAYAASLHKAREPVSKGKRWMRHHEIKSQILAAARRIITRKGYEGLSFGAVADECNISRPTIYSIVGDKSHLLQSAGSEWVEWLAAYSTVASENKSQLLGVLEAFWLAGGIDPEFGAAWMTARTEQQLSMNEAAYETGRKIITTLVTQLEHKRLLRSHINTRRFSQQLTDCTHLGACQWLKDPYDLHEFHRDLVSGPATLLLGAVCGHELMHVESGIVDILEGRRSPVN